MSQNNCRVVSNQRGHVLFIKECERLPHCLVIEPLGDPLPCETLLPFEAAGDPSPQSKPRGRARYTGKDALMAAWPGNGPVTIYDLMQATGKARSTLHDYVSRAIAHGDVICAGQDGPSLLYELARQ